MATIVTTITDYSVEVCKRLGSQYSLYTTRAINLLPEAIRQTLLANKFEANELFKDDDNNGTLLFDKEIAIPAEAESRGYLENTDSRILQILNTVLSVTSTDAFVSAIDPRMHTYAKYLNFDPAIAQVTYYMDSNYMVIQNLCVPLAAKHATIHMRKTQFINTMLTTVTTDLGQYFSYNLILQIVAMGAELLKQEVV
jgi:hypothetical protein